MTREMLDKIVLMLVSGVSVDAIERAVIGWNVPVDDAKAAIVDAQARITIAASYDKSKELGKAITRLEDLYSRSIRSDGDLRTALASQKELNRLLRLGEVPPVSPADSEDAAANPLADEIASIRAHILPLKLTDENIPLVEHVRIAADFVRRMSRPRS